MIAKIMSMVTVGIAAGDAVTAQNSNQVVRQRKRDKLMLLPLSLRSLLFLLIVCPILSVAFVLYSDGMAIMREPQLIVHRFTLPGLIILCLSPVVAWGLWRLQKWAWYSYLVLFSVLIPLCGALVWESYYLHRRIDFEILFVFLLNLGHLFFVYRLMRRKIRLAYLSDFPRDFRLSDRVPLQLPVKVFAKEAINSNTPEKAQVITGFSENMSTTGASIILDKSEMGSKWQPGNSIGLQIADFSRMLYATVCRVIDEKGTTRLGISFIESHAEQSKWLQKLLTERYAPRFKAQLKCEWHIASSDSRTAQTTDLIKYGGQTENLSRKGALIHSQDGLPEIGDKLLLSLSFKILKWDGVASMPGEVIWINSDNGKQTFGLKFNRNYFIYKRSRLLYFFFYYLKVVFREPVR